MRASFRVRSSRRGENSHCAMSSLPTGVRRVRWVGAVAWIAVAAVACAFAPLRTLEPRGPLLVLLHASDLLTVAALLGLCTAVGDAALRRLQVSFPSRRDRLPFATVLGAGVLATELLVACALLGVRPWVIECLLAATAVAVGAELMQVFRALADWLARSDKSGADRLPPMAAVGLAVGAAVLFLLALAPPSDWDSLMYHILVPSRWLHDGRMSTLGGNEHVALVGLVHVLYLPLLATRSLSGPAVLSAALALLLGLAAFSLAQRLFGPAAGRYTALLAWGTPTILLVASTAKVDVSLALFLLLGHDALLTAWRDRSPRHLDLAAVLLGLSLGVKYQAGAYAVALAPLILVTAVTLRGGRRPPVGLVVRFTSLATCAASPWLLKNQILYGAPFYPFFAVQHVDSWLAPFLAKGAAAITLDPRVFLIQQTARADFNLHDAFLNPGTLAVGGETGFYFLNPLLLLVPLCLLAVRDAGVVGLAGPSLLYVLAVLIVSPKANLRYLIPGVVPLTIVCTRMMIAGTSRLRRVLRRAVRALVVLVCLIPTAGTMYVWISGNHVVPDVVGILSGEEYLASHSSPVVRSHARMAAEINRLVAPSDTVLMLFESRGLYLNPPAIEDTRLTNWPWLAAALGTSRCLEGSGITHVLARPSAARYYEQRGVPDAVLGLESFERFAARCLTPLYTEPGAALYVARPPR
jgi:4-amino-4-deoxy-L-arabinose transferase-like glycosyltransferase